MIQGHQLDAETDWTALAKFTGTLVVFMGTGAVQEIAKRLIAAGADPERPIAMVETATDLNLQSTISTLAITAEQGLQRRTSGPGIIYIGAVVSLAAELNQLPYDCVPLATRSLQ